MDEYDDMTLEELRNDLYILMDLKIMENILRLIMLWNS